MSNTEFSAAIDSTIGEVKRLAAMVDEDAKNLGELPEHLRWRGEGPAPASWYAADGTKVYRSYSDYVMD